MTENVDILYRRAGELVSLADGPVHGGVRGAALGCAGVQHDGAIAVRDGQVVATGPDAEMARRFVGEDELDLAGYVVVPGFVDCHTHPAFGATREQEFALRCGGADYVEISRQGGGILSSVRSLRATAELDLRDLVYGRLSRFLALGTTSVEVKSGYGLTTADEQKSLEVLRDAAVGLPLTTSRTFLGAHEVAPEYRDDPQGYLRLVIDEMLPACRELADSCDVFVEEHVFGIDASRRIGEAASALGYRLRLHVDELTPLGGAELAVELGAASADHLAKVSENGVRLLAESDTTAVLLPGTIFFLRTWPLRLISTREAVTPRACR